MPDDTTTDIIGRDDQPAKGTSDIIGRDDQPAKGTSDIIGRDDAPAKITNEIIGRDDAPESSLLDHPIEMRAPGAPTVNREDWEDLPRLIDSDGDGLTDVQEVRDYGTDPELKDTDFDGVDDEMEILQGTDPTDATDRVEEGLYPW